MPEDPNPRRRPDPPSPVPAADGDVEAYETGDGVVLYDAANPLAWIECRTPIRLDDAA